MIERRAELVRIDDGFAAIYGDGRARMASADDVLASMDRAGIDVTVVAGFWWTDPKQADEHAEYLIDVADAASGKLLPFVPIAFGTPDALIRVRDYAAAGAAGLGEVRIGNRNEAVAGDWLAGLVAGLDLPVLVHTSEPVGRSYPGKMGGFTPYGLWRLLSKYPIRVIAAHWGGGFPFYALMPEVQALIKEGRLAFDSAASVFLYENRIIDIITELVGSEVMLWGSDYPLREQDIDRAEIERSVQDPLLRSALLGGNAVRFLGLD